MLIPFDRNLTYIEKFSGKYIFSFINDLFRFEENISGYILCVAQSSFGYIFFKRNKILSSSAFIYSYNYHVPQNTSFKQFLDEDEIDLYTNIIDEESLLDNIYQYFHSLYSFYAPYGLITSEKAIAYLQDKNMTGIASFRHGFIVNMAFFEKGNFKYFQYYHPDTKSYAYEHEEKFFAQYLKSLEDLQPVVLFRDFKESGIQLELDNVLITQQKDIIVKTLLCYFDIFDIILDIMLEKSKTETVYELTKKVFDKLREKYAPLYRKLYFSLDNKSVNWSEIFEDRKYIPINYRFEHYHLYMDELLKLMIKAMFALRKGDGSKVLQNRVDAYLKKTDKGDREIKQLVFRFEKLFETNIQTK